MSLSAFLYAGFAVATLAALGLVPLTFGFAGALVALGALAMPAPRTLASREPGLVDRMLPEWQFAERHEVAIHAPVERVWRAVHEVSAKEIRLFLLLTWLRSPRLRRGVAESILNPDPSRPILETALRTGFVKLDEIERDEIVFGAVLEKGRFRACGGPDDFRRVNEPGLNKAVMNFRLEVLQPGLLRLSTETRVGATDARSRRLFALYWRLILPGSALIRRNWLAAIRRRAERPA